MESSISREVLLHAFRFFDELSLQNIEIGRVVESLG
tara:strand:- start:202 stop:309 length:108 start_codon:yes stop_codon:yes gene_type:complete